MELADAIDMLADEQHRQVQALKAMSTPRAKVRKAHTDRLDASITQLRRLAADVRWADISLDVTVNTDNEDAIMSLRSALDG